jgi:branched-chain amino acid transport system ATP-binding protein
MTVLDNLKLGAYLTRDASEVRRRLEEVSRWFPVLKERLEQRAETLSGGQQQMLAIGRALMGGPKLLMIDEPSLGLAPKTKAAVLEGIRQVSTAGSVATVLVEQDVLGPSKIAGRMYVLNAGKIVAEGKPEEIVSDKEFVRTYLAGVHV